MTSAQICARAAQQAKQAGALTAAGFYLNAVLSELCQTYDLDVSRNDYSFSFNPSSVTTTQFPNNVAGSGPYNLPSDYLRCQRGEFLWYLNGQPYPMIAVDLEEFDQQVMQAGTQSYPAIFATSLNSSPPKAVIWPPASGSYTALIRYQCQMNDIGSSASAQTPLWTPGTTAPATATVVPWFPNQNYLITRVAGELMKETGDTRWQEFLGDKPWGAQGILQRYLEMDNDTGDRAQRVTLDRRRFGAAYSKLPVTKATGWGIALAMLLPNALPWVAHVINHA